MKNDLSIQVLVAAMNQTDYSLLDKMNIQSDIMVGNQCDRNEIEEFKYNEYSAKFLSFSERGVGLNRNNTLMRATADICLFADDDMVYVDGYPDIIKGAFKAYPQADVLIFNLKEDPVWRYVIKNEFKVNYLNYMRFGTARLACRTRSITQNGISFNLHFGGGTEHSHGEDAIFLHDCLKAGLTMIAIPQYIASLEGNRESSWFNGYTDKFFKDQGILFHTISKRAAKLLCMQFAIRRRKYFNLKWYDAYKMMLNGINEMKQIKKVKV